MCGRFALMTMPEVLADIFELSEIPRALTPRYNIAPTQPTGVIRLDRESRERRLDLLHWGLIPFWAKDPAIGNRMINARSETVATKPAYKNAFKRRRCLVPADGFYEWKKLSATEARAAGLTTKSPKQPVFIHMADEAPFALAGLWEHWQDPKGSGSEIDSFTILTTEANELCRDVHDRMPVIIDRDHYERWLDTDSSEDSNSIDDLLRPYPSELMDRRPVSTRVNRPQNDDASLVERVRTGLFE
ncbi:MAG: SOS response-associated peptidase [Phycisphaerales bacterium]